MIQYIKAQLPPSSSAVTRLGLDPIIAVITYVVQHTGSPTKSMAKSIKHKIHKNVKRLFFPSRLIKAQTTAGITLGQQRRVEVVIGSAEEEEKKTATAGAAKWAHFWMYG